jgi:hypothetical protein
VDVVDSLDFESELSALQLGSITFAAQRGSAQRSIRARPEIRRTTEHCFNLLLGYVAQLSPEFVLQAPLPQSVFIDQVGALLALTATELRGSRGGWSPVERSVRDEVHNHIKQRCTESSCKSPTSQVRSTSQSERYIGRLLLVGKPSERC